jgi:hypothetical protein
LLFPTTFEHLTGAVLSSDDRLERS